MDLLVLDRFDVGPEGEGPWWDWYRGDRLPRWKALGGFVAAQGYRRHGGVGGPSVLVLLRYRPDPGTVAALAAMVRGEAGAPEAGGGAGDACLVAYAPFWECRAKDHTGECGIRGPIQLVTLNVFGAKADEIAAWYQDVHIPELLEYPGLQWARRHGRLAGSGPRYLTVYHFADPGAIDSYMRSDTVRAAQADRQRFNPWMTIVEHTNYAPAPWTP